jgi:hypothetical protein
MSSFPPAAVISRPAVQIAIEPSSPIEPRHNPARGLGIDGIDVHPKPEFLKDDIAIENHHASPGVAHKYQQLPEDFGDDLDTTPTLIQDGISFVCGLPVYVKR